MGRAFAVKAVHKQMYPAKDNFKDEADDTSGISIGFVDYVTTTANTTIVSSFGSHKKVIKQINVGGNDYFYGGITQTKTGTFEWWGSPIQTNRTCIYYLREDGSIIVEISFDSNGKIYARNIDVNTEIVASYTANVWYHFKVQIYADDTFDAWIDGDLVADGFGTRTAMTSGVNRFYGRAYDGTLYTDAIGESEDANYDVGDNCFWRHYKESDDPFESEDVGTKSLSIDWIDSISIPNFAEIIAEFNEHKKIIDNFSDSTVQQMAEHYLPSTSTTGWFSVWLKTDDVTLESRVYIEDDPDLNILFRIFNSQFQVRTGGAWRQATNSPTPANNTYYFVYIQWYADNTFDLWIDNVLYEDGTANNINQVDGISRVGISSTGTADPLTVHTYFDAPTCSLDATSPERGDNRIFDYNSTYTSEDITSTITNVITENRLGKWRTGTMYSNTSYETSEIFVQVYDINSKLGMEADLKKRDQVEGGMKYKYPLRDKNQDDLENRSSNTFDVAKIHDPTDSTSMLKVILPNVGEVDGDLLLVDADTKATTYSPTTVKYPDNSMLTDIGDLANSVVIIHADGKCYMDDDKASGTVLDVDTSADFDKMTKPVLVTDLFEGVNYLEIFGAFNPATGTRFTKVVDNTSGEKKRTWRYTNNNFKTQANVDAYASALDSRVTTPKIIKIEAQSIGAHNMGETMDYKYVKAPYNVPQANYYIIYESLDYDKNHNIIIMSEGMLEESKYASMYERSEYYSDSDQSGIYGTDIITTEPRLIAYNGATQEDLGVRLNTAGEYGIFWFQTGDKIDPSRKIIIGISWRQQKVGGGTIGIAKTYTKVPLDGSATRIIFLGPDSAETLATRAQTRYGLVEWEISASDVYANYMYDIVIKDGLANQDWYLVDVYIKYHILRDL